MLVKDAKILVKFPPPPPPPKTKGAKDYPSNACYTLWCSDTKVFMASNNIVNVTQAEAAKWQSLQEFAMSHRLVRSYQQAYNGKDRIAAKFREAFKAILFDIRGRVAKKRVRSDAEEAALLLKKARTAAEDDESKTFPAALAPTAPLSSSRFARGVIIHWVDPANIAGTTDPATVAGSRNSVASDSQAVALGEGVFLDIMERSWDREGVITYTGVVHNATIPHLISLGLRQLPSEVGPRKVRNLIGAIADPPTRQNPFAKPSASVMLTEDEGVEGWLLTSKADPLCLLVILERKQASPGEITIPQTPPTSQLVAHRQRSF